MHFDKHFAELSARLHEAYPLLADRHRHISKFFSSILMLSGSWGSWKVWQAWYVVPLKKKRAA